MIQRIVRRVLRSFNEYSIKRRHDAFLKLNKQFWNKQGAHVSDHSPVIIAEHAIGYDFWALVISISTAVVASALRARVIFLMQGGRSAHGALFKFQRSFVNCDFFYLDEFYAQHQQHIQKASQEIFALLRSPDDILNIRYRNVPIGEQVYDGVIKYKHATLWKLNEKVLTKIEEAITCVDAVFSIFEKERVEAGLFTHTTCAYHGVAVRSIIAKGKPVYLGFGGFNAFYCYNEMNGPRGQLDIHIKIPPRVFDQLWAEQGKSLLMQAEQYFKKRFGGEINDWDAMRAFSPDKKLYVDRADFFHDFPTLNPTKKNVFIMLHAMNDDPHVQNQHIFKDYYDWFVTTLKFARTQPNVNWIFKQHPMIKFYPDDANLYGLFDLVNEKHIIYIDEHVPFNQASVPTVADAIITCAGTAGLEFSAFGIPAVIAAGNSYSDYGICHEPKTKEEYLLLMEKIETLGRVDESNREKAKVLFYLIYSKLIPGFLKGFLPYLNHDQMKALTEGEGLSLYSQSLMTNNENHTIAQELINSIKIMDGKEPTSLILKL